MKHDSRRLVATQWFPPAMSGETIFGWCSRYHEVAGARRASDTCSVLFGDARCGLRHDFPGRLGEFTRRTGTALGSAKDVARGRTLLGYYLLFQGDVEDARLVHAVVDDSTPHLKSVLGCLATRFGAVHPLKACDVCLAEQRHAGTMVSWKLVHQLPGVWVCPIHSTPLWSRSSSAPGRMDWLLPDGVPHEHRHRPGIELGRLATEVAIASMALINGFGEPRVDRQRFAAVVRHRLSELELAASDGRLRPDRCATQFSDFLGGFRSWPESEGLVVPKEAARATLYRVIGDQPRALHPLRYLSTVLWLFDRWADFAAAYRNWDLEGSAPTQAVEPDGAAKNRARLRLDFLAAAAQRAPASARSAAKQMGISTNTALMWLQQSGIPVTTRPKAITPEVRQVAHDMLRTGSSKVAVAERLNISIVSVTRILLADPALKIARDGHSHNLRRARSRAAWLQALEQCPSKGVKEVRDRVPAAYAWLYRNDNVWLREHQPPARLPSRQRAGRVNWAARDAMFAKAVVRAAQEVQPITSQAVIRAIPALAKKMHKIALMPATARALDALSILQR